MLLLLTQKTNNPLIRFNLLKYVYVPTKLRSCAETLTPHKVKIQRQKKFNLIINFYYNKENPLLNFIDIHLSLICGA